MARADQLHAERQALIAGAGRQGHARRAGQRPDRIETRIAGKLLTLGCLARRAGAQQDIDLVEQRIDVRLEGRRLALGGDVALERDGKALVQDVGQLAADFVGVAQALVGVVARAFPARDGDMVLETCDRFWREIAENPPVSS